MSLLLRQGAPLKGESSPELTWLGHYSYKGINDPIGVYQVSCAELRTRVFPPLRAPKVAVKTVGEVTAVVNET